jgi:hypothetical protein
MLMMRWKSIASYVLIRNFTRMTATKLIMNKKARETLPGPEHSYDLEKGNNLFPIAEQCEFISNVNFMTSKIMMNALTTTLRVCSLEKRKAQVVYLGLTALNLRGN